MNRSKKSAELWRGAIVLIALAVLTGAEFWIAVSLQWWAALMVMAVIKAGIVIQYYMHLPRVLGEEGGH